MISSDPGGRTLLARARALEAEGYERMSIVDASRARELASLYEELGHEVVVLDGAVPPANLACDACLGMPGLVTLFVRKR